MHGHFIRSAYAVVGRVPLACRTAPFKCPGQQSDERTDGCVFCDYDADDDGRTNEGAVSARVSGQPGQLVTRANLIGVQTVENSNTSPWRRRRANRLQ